MKTQLYHDTGRNGFQCARGESNDGGKLTAKAGGRTPLFAKTWLLILCGAVFFWLAVPKAQANLTTNYCDLAVGKTASTNSTTVGSSVVFQVFVTNLGPSTLTSATVQDLLPLGLGFMSSAGPGSYNPSTGSWTFGPLNSNSFSVLMITAQATNSGTFVNTATLTNSTPADTNSANNTASASVVVNGSTNAPLTLNCSSNITVAATSSSGAIVFFSSSASGGCSPPPTLYCMPPSGSTFPIGTSTVNCYANDTCGQSTNCSFTVTVTQTPIALNCSSNITVAATSSSGAIVFFTSSATGGCSPPPTLSCMPPSGSTFPIGTSTVYCYANDTCGQSTNCSFSVTVTQSPLVLHCSSNITAAATSSGGAIVFFTSSASGGCNPPPTISCMPPSGSTFPIGTTTVYCYANDSCGQSTNCSFSVTVTQTPLVLNCSSNITVTASSSNGATVFFTSSASGGCSPPPSLSCMPPSGSTFPIGTNTVNCFANDSCGQSTNCSFTIIVNSAGSQADLQLTKTVSTNSPVTGQTTTFTVVVQNLGPNNITNAVVTTDCLPAGFQYVTDSTLGTATNGTYSPGTCWWTLPNGINAGQSFNLQITVLATNAGVYTNTATVAVPSGVTDPNLANNMASVVVTVRSAPVDLQVTKTVGTNSVYVGHTAPFTVTVTNVGAGAASNITVADVLPAGLTFSSAGVPGGTTYNQTNGVWSIASLAPGSGYSLALSALATNTGTFTNLASLTGSSPADTNSANNSGSAVVTASVQLLPVDFQITKSVAPTNPVAGQQVVFTITIADLGPNDVTNNLVITDCLPAGFQYVTDSTLGLGAGTYSPGTCQWTLRELDTNASLTLTITATATNTGVFTNTATVAVPAGYSDPNLTNNSASAIVTVSPAVADLAVTKTVDTNALPVNSAAPFNFRLTVTNLGPNTVTNVTVSDVLPPGLAYSSSINGPDSSFQPSNGVWRILTNLAAGQGSAMTLGARGTNSGTFINKLTVNVPATATDPNTNNNSAQVAVTALPVYEITGFVNNCRSNGLSLANVTVTLSGAGTKTTTTQPNGFYRFTYVSNGNYTITPSQAGNVFAPLSAPITVNNSNITAPTFVGSIGLIYGQVSYFGNAITNHPVMLAGGGLAKPRTVVTDATGNYIFTNTPAGNYTVTAVPTNGYRFTPTNAAIVLDATNCAALTNFVAATNRIVQLVALEVVQVIQDWSNSVPLISAKKTFVRAHLQLPTNGPAILLQGARLYGSAGGSALPGSPQAPFAPGGSPDLLVQTTNASLLRGSMTNSLNFELPPGWSTSGPLTLQFVCTNNVTVVPANTVPANSSVQVGFVATPIPPIKYYGFNWTNSDSGVFQQVDAGIYGTVPSRVVAIYPVPDVTANRSVLVPPATLDVPAVIPLSIPAGLRTVPNWALLNANAKLLQIQALDQLLSLWYGATNWIYCGVLAGPTTGTLGWAGAFVTSSNTVASKAPNISASFLLTNVYGVARQTIPHEIGHNLGFPHDVSFKSFGYVTNAGVADTNLAVGACNVGPAAGLQYPLFQPIPPPAGPLKPTLGPMTNGANSIIYGLDTFTLLANATNPVADPYNCFDLMSYCRSNSPLERWTSTYTYAGFRASITNLFTPPPPPPPPGPGRKWLYIRGFVDSISDLGAFEPFLTMLSTAANPPAAPPPGIYLAVLYDGFGNIIGQISFGPQGYLVEETGAIEAMFTIPVLADPAIKQVRVYDTQNNALVASIGAPTNLPSVSSVILSATNGGPFTGVGPLVIHWSSFDSDPHAQLTYTIQFSTDGGVTWDTLEVDWPSLTYQIDSLFLRATTQGLIRIMVSDGFNTSDPAVSSMFTIPNHPPQVNLLAPAVGAIYLAGEQLFLEAFANDPQDGPLDGLNVQWISSRDGVLGYGAVLNFDAAQLSEGSHVLTVTATDSFGLTNSASVQIFVLRLPPPQLSITINGTNRADIAWSSSVTNYVLEASTSVPSGTWTTVTNVPVAADAEQKVTVDFSPAARFFRLRHQ